jgi:hypothetical protein
LGLGSEDEDEGDFTREDFHRDRELLSLDKKVAVNLLHLTKTTLPCNPMGLCQPLDGVTNLEYNLLCF